MLCQCVIQLQSVNYLMISISLLFLTASLASPNKRRNNKLFLCCKKKSGEKESTLIKEIESQLNLENKNEVNYVQLEEKKIT